MRGVPRAGSFCLLVHIVAALCPLVVQKPTESLWRYARTAWPSALGARWGHALGPRWGADPLPGVAGAALSPGGVKYFVACAARPSARSSRCFVAGALLSQGPVQISWQARHFQGQAQPSCQAHHFCQVRLRFPNRALRRATRLLAAPAEIPCCSYGSKRQLIDS